MSRHQTYDEIGPWSEVKLEIIRKYAAEYSKILTAQQREHINLHHAYIDAFAGPGTHVSRTTGEWVPGSPQIALEVKPPFEKYYFIDLSREKIETLREAIGERSDVHIFEGDCNHLLLTEIFPQVCYNDYRRALCLLDPYGLHLNWEVIKTAGQMGSIEIFLNFPVADMNRNALRRDPERVDANQVERMNAFWGDESWREVAYNTQGNLFGLPVKEPNEIIAEAFQERLRKVAGFSYVPKPMPMRNSKGVIIYYLFFAAQKPVAADIVTEIFQKYR